MKTKKMSLANIQGKLSRAEMKNIMAGSGTSNCNSDPCGSALSTICGEGCYCMNGDLGPGDGGWCAPPRIA